MPKRPQIAPYKTPSKKSNSTSNLQKEIQAQNRKALSCTGNHLINWINELKIRNPILYNTFYADEEDGIIESIFAGPEHVHCGKCGFDFYFYNVKWQDCLVDAGMGPGQCWLGEDNIPPGALGKYNEKLLSEMDKVEKILEDPERLLDQIVGIVEDEYTIPLGAEVS
ncbi:hypothetical protein niasHT_031215 [Heterodera trifolii]|uniref:Uncharacterized protein n=1 Tax=Heterodera trifolii TaxID=157864 RepID=A0ABD2ISX2_9BILA